MIDPHKRAEIKRLLTEGETQIAVATQVGVSLSTVHRIRCSKQQSTAQHSAPWFDERGLCEQCGVEVTLPCLRCALLAAGRGATPDTEKDLGLILGLNLWPWHHARYLEVRKTGKSLSRKPHPTGPEQRAAPLHHLPNYHRHEPRPREHDYENPDADE